MQEFSAGEILGPGEGGTSAAEKLSEQAKERFQESVRQVKQIQKEERKARKRDDRVAKTIIQFLGDDRYTHLFQLIARLVARDCPSIFILAILSLIHKPSRETVEEYIQEHRIEFDSSLDQALALKKESQLGEELRKILVMWMSRLELVMSIDGEKILRKLMVDEANIEGSVLQLTTFVLVEFFDDADKPIPFKDLQPLTVNVLQTIIGPFLHLVEEHFEQMKKAASPAEED